MITKINDKYLRAKIKMLKKSAKEHRRNFRAGKRRFGLCDYLADIYACYLELQSHGIAKKAGRRIIRLLHLSIQKRSHPIRVLIEASAGAEDKRQKSRWTQALLYVLGWKVGPEKVTQYLRFPGGIAGCAKKQAMNKGTSRQKMISPTSGLGDLTSSQADTEARLVTSRASPVA